jgi:hypothetical protein
VKVVKAKLKADQIHDRFTIATTRWTVAQTSIASMVGASDAARGVERVNQGDMFVKPTDLQPWAAYSTEPVKIGDPVEVEVHSIPQPSSPTNEHELEDTGQSPAEVTSYEPGMLYRISVRGIPATVVRGFVGRASTNAETEEKMRRARRLLDHFDGEAFVFPGIEGAGYEQELKDILRDASTSPGTHLPPSDWKEEWDNFEIVRARE